VSDCNHVLGGEPIVFLASFPNIASAIRVAGDGGARILLDISEDEMPAIVRLMLMRGRVLKITVEDYYATAKNQRRSESGGAG
jgi:hypothetical protein